MMVEDPNDPLDQCPLQKSHMIRRSRMAVHLSKCAVATNAESTMAQCLFDTTHWVQQPFLEYHMKNQCDKRELYLKAYDRPDSYPNTNPSPLTHKTELPPPEENWDDGPATSYDPHLKASSEAVLRTICVAPKSKRKEFRQQEVERFQELAQQGKVMIAVPPRVWEPKEPAPLRQPRVEVSKVVGVGRGIFRQDRHPEAVGKAANTPKAEAVSRAANTPKAEAVIGAAKALEVEEAMNRLQLDEPKPSSSDAESWSAVGRGYHRKKDYQQLRQPETSPGGLGYVVPNRDAIAVSRGRGRPSNS